MRTTLLSAAMAALFLAATGCAAGGVPAKATPAGSPPPAQAAGCDLPLLRQATATMNGEKGAFTASMKADGGPAVTGFFVNDQCFLVMRTDAPRSDRQAGQLLRTAGPDMAKMLPPADGFKGLEITYADGSPLYTGKLT